ncbi:GreA/GreB family elongation factor [Pseudoxanthobacter sp.]|uniref:GreA/GreB family elongation factor n=1 Tax=Pseudoxanthobacter sp. TaxID=1925742 RepID=UPI002FE0F1DE
MSRAFVKESDGADDLPERPVPEGRNLVTRRGLALIEAEIAAAREALAAAGSSSDRALAARASRDLRYWTRRRQSAEPVDAPAGGADTVIFGALVTLEASDGTVRRLRLVGADEADPAAGRIAWSAPLARALIGREIGDEVTLAGQPAEIVAIDTTPEPA